MDEDTIYRLERQSFFIYPFCIFEFTKKLEDGIIAIFNEGFEQCQKKFHAIDEDVKTEDSETELGELDDLIQLAKDEYIENCKNAIAKIRHKLEEFTYIPNEVDLDSDDDEICDEAESYKMLRQECLEVKVCYAHLNQELKEYEMLEPVLNAAEDMIKVYKNKPDFKPNEDVLKALVDITKNNSEYVYRLLKRQ